jgi:hypothetical protein
LETHPLPTASEKVGIDGATFASAVSSEQFKGKRDRPISKRGPRLKGPTDHEILALLPHAVIAQSVFNMIQRPNKGWEWPAID